MNSEIDYTRTFNASNPNWTPDHNRNKFYLLAIESFANRVLDASGYLFLNEVLAHLGFDKTDYGQVVGWIKNPESKDQAISFGISKFADQTNPDISLSFNVDGEITSILKGN